MKEMEQKNLNRIGAVVLVVAASVLSLMGEPSSLMPLKTGEEISVISYNGDDRIAPLDLAEALVSADQSITVIDLRNPADFAEFHIDGSLNIPFTSLMTPAGVEMVPAYKKNVLVCDDGSRSGQAWTVLRHKGYEVYILDGGMKGWWRTVMKPDFVNPEDLVDIDVSEYAAKLKTMRDHFSGVETELGTAPSENSAPTPPPPVPSAKKGKKKSGGC